MLCPVVVMMISLSLQLEISGLDRVRRATPGTSLHLNCLVAGLVQGEEGEGEEPQQSKLIWSERRLGEEEERMVSSVRLEGEPANTVTTLLPGFTSLLLTEKTENSLGYSWQLIIENVSPDNSAVYQCKVIET